MTAIQPLMHRDAAERLYDQIVEHSAIPGILPSLRDVDIAIQSSAELWLEEQGGGPMPAFEYDSPRFGEIVDDVLERLGLAYDDVFEVA